ncbi:MAG TPA: CoA-binding protein [Dehalococcoidia bacterium]|nr:CoA-binding protein [Dehalococcoidia bacterium]
MNSQSGGDLRAFFEPSSIAVIGSLREWGGLGYTVIKNIRQFNFTGRVYPINPSSNEAFGLKVYRDVGAVQDPIDLAIVITPTKTVSGIIEQCAQKGVKAAIIVSDGFAETGESGARLQRELVKIGQRTGLRIVGPNTIGTLNTDNGLVTNPYFISYDKILKGNIAYCSQSGIVGAQGQPLKDQAYPISKMCDLGNKCDVNEVDLLNYLSQDPQTRVIVMHIEDIKDGHKFINTVRKVVARKPVLLLKPGRTERGAKASASHTGSLSGSERIYNAAFRQAGAIRLNTWREFWEIPRVFVNQPLPKGNRIAIITITGGVGVASVDTAEECGLAVADFSPVTVNRLSRLSPQLASNPVDVGPIIPTLDNPWPVLEETIAAVLDDPNVDCVTATLYISSGEEIPVYMDIFDRLMKNITKPVSIWIYGTDLGAMQELLRKLQERGLPAYLDIELAIKSLAVAAYYFKVKSNLDLD